MEYLILFIILFISPLEFESINKPPPKATDWIKDLGHNEFSRREAATEFLKKARWDVHTLLLTAKQSADPEVRKRAKELLSILYALPELNYVPIVYFNGPTNKEFKKYSEEFKSGEIWEFNKKHILPYSYLRKMVIKWYHYKSCQNKQLIYDDDHYKLATELMCQDLRSIGVTIKSIENLLKWMEDRIYSYPWDTSFPWIRKYWNIQD